MMNVLSDETVKKVLDLGIISLSASGDLIIGKQIIIAAFSEIIESRQKDKSHPSAYSSIAIGKGITSGID